MPTVLTHAAVPLAIGLGLGRQVISRQLLLSGVLLSMLPDLDVLAFRLGIPYASVFGHRGFSHSLLCALLVALAVAGLLHFWRERFRVAFPFLLLAMASHGLLDAFTNGGKGIALLWPWTQQRFFAPIQVIEVAPLSAARWFSERGAAVLYSELGWVWLPCLALAAGILWWRMTRWADSRGAR